jgi:hypothetical protein
VDAAQAVLVVVAPVGAAIVAFAKILLDRHLRLLDQIAGTIAAEMRAERESREASLRLLAESIESFRAATSKDFDELKSLVREQQISDLVRAVRDRLDTIPDDHGPRRRRPSE